MRAVIRKYVTLGWSVETSADETSLSFAFLTGGIPMTDIRFLVSVSDFNCPKVADALDRAVALIAYFCDYDNHASQNQIAATIAGDPPVASFRSDKINQFLTEPATNLVGEVDPLLLYNIVPWQSFQDRKPASAPDVPLWKKRLDCVGFAVFVLFGVATAPIWVTALLAYCIWRRLFPS